MDQVLPIEKNYHIFMFTESQAYAVEALSI